MSEIFTAIENKDHLSISLLLPTNVQEKNIWGDSVLMKICAMGLHQHIEHAIKCGANVYEKDNDGWTVLRHAIFSRCITTVKTILRYKPDLNARDIDYDAPIQIVISYANNLEILKLLVKAGADINVVDDENQSLLFYCGNNTSSEILEYLIYDLKLDINYQNIDGDTPLICAAINEHNKLVDMLLTYGADKSIQNKTSMEFEDYWHFEN